MMAVWFCALKALAVIGWVRLLIHTGFSPVISGKEERWETVLTVFI